MRMPVLAVINKMLISYISHNYWYWAYVATRNAWRQLLTADAAKRIRRISVRLFFSGSLLARFRAVAAVGRLAFALFLFWCDTCVCVVCVCACVSVCAWHSQGRKIVFASQRSVEFENAQIQYFFTFFYFLSFAFRFGACACVCVCACMKFLHSHKHKYVRLHVYMCMSIHMYAYAYAWTTVKISASFSRNLEPFLSSSSGLVWWQAQLLRILPGVVWVTWIFQSFCNLCQLQIVFEFGIRSLKNCSVRRRWNINISPSLLPLMCPVFFMLANLLSYCFNFFKNITTQIF